MLFYDFEVFAYDWLVVIIDMTKKSETVIHNDPDKLQKIYDENINDIGLDSIQDIMTNTS